MKKFFVGFFLIVFCIFAASADDAGGASRAIALDSMTTVSDESLQISPVRAATPRNAQSTRASGTANATEAMSSSTTANRSVSRNVSAESTPSDSARTSAATRTGVSSRTSATPDAQAQRSVTNNARTGTSDAQRVTAATERTATRTSVVNNTAATRRTGVAQRASAVDAASRTTSATADVTSGQSLDRAVQVRAAATTKETITEATERLQQTADLNKTCQSQYNDCMDQFCAVIDANQKRCSCSSNLSRYTKVETAVKDANTQLNEVAQRIRYIGLSADEIRAIMSATEAEDALSGTRDTTESRNMLDEIEKLIKNPTSATSYSGDSFSGLDMDLDFSGEATDLFTLDFLGTNTSSFSNLRGTELYNAAKKRCNTVLTQCKGAGATSNQITGNYDLSIDKDCIAYEQGLTKMNETLKNNVRSANQMLQKARLAVLQNKNQYDAKGCISALNTCMTDDMVCGGDYAKCLDPTKRYIDENGTVVLGQRIADITDFTKNYNNAAINQTFLSTAKNQMISFDACKAEAASGATGGNDGSCIVRYLLEKIGTGATVKDGGLCRAVLDKCQYVTYDSNGNYKPYNEVTVNYIQRAMVNIQAAQQKIISDYASNCMVDIASCYNQQVSQVNAWSSTASVNSVYNVMRGACRNVALTCAYAVFAAEGTGTDSLCPSDQSDADKCINSVSDMFYQSLLCPENSMYQETTKKALEDKEGTDEEKAAAKARAAGYVNERCECYSGYEPWGNACYRSCQSNEARDSSGYCKVCSAGSYLNISGSSKTCTSCQAGYYCEGGETDPVICPPDHYCIAGSPAPVKCDNNKTTEGQGSRLASDCKAAPTP